MIFVKQAQRPLYDMGQMEAMQPLSIVVGVCPTGGFGKDGKIPWYFPEDLKHFKKVTNGGICIMGRRTYEDMLEMVKAKRKKPWTEILPGRKSIVLTRQKDYKAEGAEVANSLLNAILSIEEGDNREIFIIGGVKVYIEALPWVSKVYMTIVQEEYECDRFFPIPYITKNFKIANATKSKNKKLQMVEYKRVKR